MFAVRWSRWFRPLNVVATPGVPAIVADVAGIAGVAADGVPFGEWLRFVTSCLAALSDIRFMSPAGSPRISGNWTAPLPTLVRSASLCRVS